MNIIIKGTSIIYYVFVQCDIIIVHPHTNIMVINTVLLRLELKLRGNLYKTMNSVVEGQFTSCTPSEGAKYIKSAK